MSDKVQLDDGVDVKREDQQKINKFACNNARLQELQEDLEQKKKDLDNLKEAENEVLLIDDSVVLFFVGEIFFNLPKENIEDELELEKKNCRENISNIELKIQKIQELLQQLKGELYAKFGGNINLEPTSKY